MKPTNKALLLILDGWGEGKKDVADAIFHSNTPFMDGLNQTAPHSTLKTFGNHVGLPDGQMGNSEVGHLNIGAGRIVWQMLVRINKAFEDRSILELNGFKKMVSRAIENPKKQIHLLGLVSDGGVHSSMDHLIALCSILKELNLDDRTFIHAILDGRDTDPESGIDFMKTVLKGDIGQAKVASICGRYYTMDRDKRWERTQKAYDLLVKGIGSKADDPISAIQKSYDEGVTDEFLLPVSILQNGTSVTLTEGDVVFCFNFRTDRGRQITTALTQQDFPDYGMQKMNLHYFTMTEYDKSFQGVDIIFEQSDLQNTMGEVLERNGLSQLRAAETEKYPHVTFFFSGGREEPFKDEHRVLVNSPKVATYDLQPEMSAPELTDQVIESIKEHQPDFACVNFANPDMVGHTGVYDAIKKACETVDGCAEKLCNVALENHYNIIIIADHGNADNAVNPDGSPNTAHSVNLVPCYLLGSSETVEIKDGVLADVAPTLLKLMGIEQPPEMDGVSLLV
jgi:2,3-bisphosphoglycerate-independent phosphoglycerate mutase